MTLADHFAAIRRGDIAPRVVLHDNRPPRDWLYVAWTPAWEGPARPDHNAAAADLRERLSR
jgi:hypothetical protein